MDKIAIVKKEVRLLQFPVNSNTESDYYILTPCFSIRFTFDAYKLLYFTVHLSAIFGEL